MRTDDRLPGDASRRFAHDITSSVGRTDDERRRSPVAAASSSAAAAAAAHIVRRLALMRATG